MQSLNLEIKMPRVFKPKVTIMTEEDKARVKARRQAHNKKNQETRNLQPTAQEDTSQDLDPKDNLSKESSDENQFVKELPKPASDSTATVKSEGNDSESTEKTDASWFYNFDSPKSTVNSNCFNKLKEESPSNSPSSDSAKLNLISTFNPPPPLPNRKTVNKISYNKAGKKPKPTDFLKKNREEVAKHKNERVAPRLSNLFDKKPKELENEKKLNNPVRRPK